MTTEVHKNPNQRLIIKQDDAVTVISDEYNRKGVWVTTCKIGLPNTCLNDLIKALGGTVDED